MIEKILASTVVSAIVTGIILIFDNNRKNCISNITDERRKWREDIREIVEKLGSNDKNEQKKALIKLKPRINAYGQGIESYERDHHIWETIKKIENEKKDVKKHKMLIEQLIDYLDLLLKYDWERSKREIKLNVRNMVQVFFGLILSIYFISINKFDTQNVFSTNCGIIIKSIICTVSLIYILPQMLCVGFYDKKLQENKKIRCVISLITVIAGCFIEFYLCKWIKAFVNLDAICFICAVLEMIYYIWCKYLNLDFLYEYVDAIKRVDKKYIDNDRFS